MVFKIKEERCIGCRICQSICPKCFSIENGLAKVLDCDPEDCDSKQVSESCPCQAIIVDEDAISE